VRRMAAGGSGGARFDWGDDGLLPNTAMLPLTPKSPLELQTPRTAERNVLAALGDSDDDDDLEEDAEEKRRRTSSAACEDERHTEALRRARVKK
jgi:hypothetical protein